MAYFATSLIVQCSSVVIAHDRFVEEIMSQLSLATQTFSLSLGHDVLNATPSLFYDAEDNDDDDEDGDGDDNDYDDYDDDGDGDGDDNDDDDVDDGDGDDNDDGDDEP